MSIGDMHPTWREWLDAAEQARQGATTPRACAEWMATYADRLFGLARACAEAVEAAGRLADTCDQATIGGRALQRVTEAHERLLRRALLALQGVGQEDLT